MFSSDTVRDHEEACDVLIAGGGAAGLSAAAHLVAGGLGARRVVVVEPRTEFPRDRTFCHWDVGPPHLFSQCAQSSWSSWRVREGGVEVVRGSTTHPYRCIPSDVFYREAIARLRGSPQVTLRLGERVDYVREEDDGVVVRSSSGAAYRARLVLDSRPVATNGVRSQPGLLQHFRGAFVRAARPVFDPAVATLMDFDVSQDRGIHFFYVLPFDRERALVEATFFSKERLPRPSYDAAIGEYLRSRYGIETWHVDSTEEGTIPMTSSPAPPGTARIVHIGLAGGLAKPTTGYAFLAIQRHSFALATSILRGERPAPPTRTQRTQALDRVFLSFLERQPARAPAAFRAIFEHAPADAVVRFLSDVGTPKDDLRIIRAAPGWPLVGEVMRAPFAWFRG